VKACALSASVSRSLRTYRAITVFFSPEAGAIGERVGCPITQSSRDRHAVTRKLGDFVPSMLQDARAGRPLELDALTGAVRELGDLVGVPTPNVDAIHGLTRLWMSAR
jgi:2-dehydropantoate 2-reductase